MRNAWIRIDRFLSQFLPPAVRVLLSINVGLFILYVLLVPLFRAPNRVFFFLMETPELAIRKACVWQFATYMFLHRGAFHLLVNMMVLWFFAPRLEYRWGTRGFVRFYFVVGIGAGLFHALVAYTTGNTLQARLAHDPNLAAYVLAALGKAGGFSLMDYYTLHARGVPVIPMLGASGALYGILLAYALYYPDDTVLLYFVFPIKVRYLVIVCGAIAFLASMGGARDNIAHVTHLGGLLVALVYLKWRNWRNWRNWLRGPWRGGGRRVRVYRVDPRRHPDYR
ncbi:rhomboid family intramembrane serine protease [Candidatus Sumerlaeota bacterium]|nr:rhomboid family intramembrane serine protease [Candidatus Sumerlaeota bacterium]